jgi:DNA-binding winged helix-turn-helix (wHTH) protein
VTDTEQQILCFGTFELNVSSEELRQSGALVKLPPQPLRLLALLASRTGELVPREEIQREFWGEETEVDFERRMNQCIKQIRMALSDNTNQPVYIETIRAQGYRFLVPVETKTIALPPPQVREASSSLLNLDRVRARIAAVTGSGSSPAVPPDATTAAPTQEIATVSGSGIPVRYVAIAIAVIAMVAGVVYWYLQQ